MTSSSESVVTRTKAGACGSSKREAATGPGAPAGPEWPHKRNSPLGFRSPRDGSWDPKQHVWAPKFPLPARHGPPRVRTGRAWSGPKGGPKRPKITKNRAWRLRDRRQGCPPSVFLGRIHSGTVWVALLSFFAFAPKCCLLAQFGPVLGPHCIGRSKTENWRTESRFRGHLFPLPTPLLVVFTPQNGPNPLLDAGFARRVPALPRFGVCSPGRAH